jgi:hypothetical protein
MTSSVNFETYKVFLNLLLKELKASFGEDVILSFAVFGSVARGEARPNSDIDILIVHKEVSFNPTGRFVDILFELKRGEEYRRLKERGLDPDPYPIFMTARELWENPHILLDLLDEGIILYDTGLLKERLGALRRRLAELGSKKVVLENGKWYWDLKPDWKPGEVIEL